MPTRLRHAVPAGRLVDDTLRFLKREFYPFEPYDPVPPELVAKVNRLLVRGARFLARAPGWQRAKPLPSVRFFAREAVIALLKLAYRTDPDIK